jgi:hypothetical protein
MITWFRRLIIDLRSIRYLRWYVAGVNGQRVQAIEELIELEKKAGEE